jgi:hypothetical protein
MLSVQNFNNLLNGNSFNRIFADTPTPSEHHPVIDLSSGGETDDYEIVGSSQANRKRHHSIENLSTGNKRKLHENLQLYNDSQKIRNRNVPLKKRGANNREEELNFLNLIASEDSNQAQNLKIECPSNGSTAQSTVCDSTSSSAPQKRLYHNLEPKDKKNENSNICTCFDCFPTLGSSNAGPKIPCRKLFKLEASSSSSSSTPNHTSNASTVDSSMIPGPSGLQKKTNDIPIKTQNFCDSDDEYDSDEQIPQTTNFSVEAEPVEVKTDALTAPHLQLDWLSDSSQGEVEEEDDDVIFINDRTEPIDLTADSDSENDRIAATVAEPSSVDAASIDRRSTGENVNVATVWPSPLSAIVPSLLVRSHPPVLNSHRIMSQIPPIGTPRVVVNIPGPIAPPQRTHNITELITGNDVMLFGGAQNYSTRNLQDPSRMRTISPITLAAAAAAAAASENVNNESSDNETGLNSNSSSRNASLPQQQQQQQPQQPSQQPHQQASHHNRHHFRFYHAPTLNAVHRPNNESSSNTATPISQVSQQTQQTQNCRQHIGRCPFVPLDQGHYYNRPRRLPRESYFQMNNRPYAVHEDLWRRQYQEQEIRRQFWSPSFNDTAPEVQVLRPPPATPHHLDPAFPHRLVSNLNDSGNSNGVPPSDILNRSVSLERIQRMQRRRSQWYNYLSFFEFLIAI